MFRTTSALLTATAALAAAAAIAACGSSSSSTSSTTSSAGHVSYAQAVRDADNFAGCIRSHGVPSFPDPSSPKAFKTTFAGNENSPAFLSADAACQHLLPGGGPHGQSEVHSQAQNAAFVAFARCIRSHGFPSFPDPTSSGELNHEMLASAGINLHQPAVLDAADACVTVTHGFITKAAVAQFVAGQ